MAELFTLPKARPLTTAGKIRPGSKLTFTQVGNLTEAAIYSNSGCTVEHDNPVVADGNGEFAAIYLNAPRDAYLTTAEDSAVWGPITCLAGESASDVSLVPSSGASTTDVQTFLRAVYARTAAEIAASVTPTYYYYAPGDVRRYGAVSGAADVTSAFAAAALVAASHPTYIPAGTWNISSVTFTDGAVVKTDGFSTVIAQLAGYDGSPNAIARIVNLAGSNIVFALEGVKITGNIATDSDEQNHAVFVRKTGANIDNITIGDVYGQDIRGDVLYIGAPSGYTVTNVRYGRITANNILRNIVSIVNGVSQCHGVGAVADGAVGLCAYDIEPDTDPSTDISIDYIKGRFVQVAPPNAADYADRITIGVMDLDPSYSANSTPGYASHISTYGLSTRNCRMLQIGNARIRNFSDFAWFQTFNPGELADQRIYFGHLEVSGCGASESTYNSPCVATSMAYVEVASGKFSLQAVGDYCFYGNPSPATSDVATRFDVSDFSCDGTVVRYAGNSRFDGIVINTTNAASAFRDLTNCTISNSDITIPTLSSNLTNVTFANVKATCSSAYLGGTSADVSFENCSGGLEGVSSPAQITSNQNDYSVGQAVTDLRLSTDASRDLTGITNGRKGRALRLFNVGSFDLVLKNDVTSTAANRFLLGADLTVGTNEGVVLWYDSTSSRWRCASRV